MVKQARLWIAVLTAIIITLTYIPAAGPAFADEAEDPSIEDLVISYDQSGEEVPLEEVDPSAYDGFLCVLDQEADPSGIDQMENQIEAIDDSGVCQEICEDQIVKAESLDVIEEIAEPEMIEYIEPDYRIYPMGEIEACGTGYGKYDSYNSSAYDMISIASVWKKMLAGTAAFSNKKPRIAVLDTGIIGWNNKKARHEDLDYSKFPYALKSSLYSNYEDTDGHGTFVTGQIAAVVDKVGVSGLMPSAYVIPSKVMDSNGGLVSAAVSALNLLKSKGNIDVVNMSFGSAQYSKAFASACKSAAASGMILVAAAGNDGTGKYYYPAAYDSVVSVAAVNRSGSHWKYSQHNDAIDAAAPGTKITGLGISSTNKYCVYSGTSMAAPMVSSLAAMVKAIDPSVKYRKFIKILKATSTDKGNSGYDKKYGFGIINFASAYDYVVSGCPANAGKQTAVAKPGKGKIKVTKIKKKKIKIKIKKLKKATSYQIAIKVKGGSYVYFRTGRVSGWITGLVSKRYFYIKVRGIRSVDGVNYYGKWSKVRKIRTK